MLDDWNNYVFWNELGDWQRLEDWVRLCGRENENGYPLENFLEQVSWVKASAHLWYWNFLDHWVRLWNRNVLCDVLDDDLDRLAIGHMSPRVSAAVS